MYYLCSESKDADQAAQLICAFVFIYVKIRFSHDVAHVTFGKGQFLMVIFGKGQFLMVTFGKGQFLMASRMSILRFFSSKIPSLDTTSYPRDTEQIKSWLYSIRLSLKYVENKNIHGKCGVTGQSTNIKETSDY